MYLYSGDDRLRPDSSVLLCLLLYSDFILSVPEPADISSPWHCFSLPDLVVRHMRLPFLCHSHWHSSPHTQLSEKSMKLMSIMAGLYKNNHVISLFVIFWVFPWRLIIECRRFRMLYLFHLQRLDMKCEVW